MEPVKIVVHCADGRVIKGYTQDFARNRPSFHVRWLPTAHDSVEVLVKDLKGVFFVQDFEGDPKYREQKDFPDGVKHQGKRVEVTFQDGEVIIGSTLSYDRQGLGFFIIPADPKWNTLRIFAVSKAVSKVRFM